VIWGIDLHEKDDKSSSPFSSVLLCVAMCCSVIECVAMCYSVLSRSPLVSHARRRFDVLQCVAV